MRKHFVIACLGALLCSCTPKESNETRDDRYPVLLNMVHHNPGEPLFTSKYVQADYIKDLGYNGQVPKFEIQCAVTYDDYDYGVVPENTPERMWIERKAHDLRVQLDNATRAGVPMYPFTDMLVVPASVMKKYGEEMMIDGKFSILKPRTQEIVRAQVKEIFKRYPELGGLTVRHGETYLHDTPFHQGTTPARTPKEHTVFINILRDEVCVQRNKKLFYRTWDFGKFHVRPDFYVKAVKGVEFHPNLYMSIKHTKRDFQRDMPFNECIGLGHLQQIVEVSTAQAGLYGRNAHPYYIGQGIIEGWPEMDLKKGLQDLYNVKNVKGFWTWTWGDGWYGPYYSNELWIDLNEYVIREFAKHPLTPEKELFNDYATNVLHMTEDNIVKFRELCNLSVMAVYKGQATKLVHFYPWWIRDHFFTGIDLSKIVKANKQKEVLAEKTENLKTWYKMEEISKTIEMPNKKDEEFLRVSTTYGRIKYELIDLIFQTQIMFAEMDKGKAFDKATAQKIVDTYAAKWEEWLALKKAHTCCPTLYVDYDNDHCHNPPFRDCIAKLKALIAKN